MDGQGRRFGKDGGARIALLLGGAPELGVAWGVQLNLPRLELGFLEAEEICVQLAEGIQEAFLHAGPQTVYVPRDEAQGQSPFPDRAVTKFFLYHSKKKQKLQPIFQKSYKRRKIPVYAAT